MRWNRNVGRVGVLLVAVLVGCSRESALPNLPEARNVVLISLDTCRADHLSCYGFAKLTTPNIDAFAREAVLFENTVTNSSSTLPAHCSLLTGTTPPYHGVHANNSFRLAPLNVTLAERLKKKGFTTAAFVGSFMLDAQFGLNQGFDTYDDDMTSGSVAGVGRTERSAESVNEAAFAWLDAHAKDRFFLMVHYFDAHTPYDPPEPFRSRFADDAYSGGIAYLDEQVGRLLDKIKSLGIYESTLVVLTADHGEGLGDHGEQWHTYFVYHSTTKVPLIIKPPGQVTATRIQEKVGLVDIVPTVLAAVRAPVAAEAHGRDLSPLLQGRSSSYPDRFFFSESIVPTLAGCNALFAIEDNAWKYIQSRRPELYDLARDPGEKNNLYAQETRRARVMAERLRESVVAMTRVSTEETSMVLDAQSQAKLQSLGYLGGVANDNLAFETDKEDPKDFVEIYEMIVMATDLMVYRDAAGVERIANRILAIRPDVSKAHEFIGIVTDPLNVEKRRYHFQQAIRYNSDSAEGYFGLGMVFGRTGDLLEAERCLTEAVRIAEGGSGGKSSIKKSLLAMGGIHPVLFKARLNLADTFARQRKLEEAIKSYRKALYRDSAFDDPGHNRTVKTLGFMRFGEVLSWSQRPGDAVKAYEAALELTPGFGPATEGIERLRGSE